MKSFIVHMKGGLVQNFQEARRIFALLDDGMHMVKITRAGQRSLCQNAYFHGVMLPIVKDGLREAGWEHIQDEEDAKQEVKKLFLTRQYPNAQTGEMHTKVLQTSKLTKLEFSEFIEQIIQWGVEYLGIEIPYPNEYPRRYDSE